MKRSTVTVAVVAGVVAGGAVGAAASSGGGNSKTTTIIKTIVSAQGAASVPTSLTTTQGKTINDIYRADSPGVVDIIVTSQSSGNSLGFFGGSSTQQTQGEGAGVVYDNAGYIITDEHVVAGAVSVKVNFWNGKSYAAKVIGPMRPLMSA